MTDKSDRESRWRLLRDVLLFQVKLAMEAMLDVALIPISLAAAGLDLVMGNWRQPRWFHAALRFGERCERKIDVWRVTTPGSDTPPSDVDEIIRDIGTVIRHPSMGPDKVLELRRWAAKKLTPGDDAKQ